MYTINELGIAYFKSPGFIPWQQIVALEAYSPEQFNDKTWKLFVKMKQGYSYPSNWWVRLNIKDNRRISHGRADFIIIVSYLTAAPQQTIEAIMSIHRQHSKRFPTN